MADTTITVIVPVRNEAAYIEATATSLRNQVCCGFNLEFLFVDGRSTDGTRQILERHAALDPRITILDNARQITPAAFNIGLQAARGEFVCILGAHAEYPPDYVAICFHELLKQGATACSGRLETVPSSQKPSALLAAWCLQSRFASGNSVRTYRGGFVDTVPFPVVRKAALLEAGGYDEELRRNQDNDMNRRLVARGHRMYLTPHTQARYYARPNLASLAHHAYRTGYWNARTLRRNAACMSPRHFAPLGFLVTVLILALTGAAAFMAHNSPRFPLLGLAIALGSHLLMGMVVGMEKAYRQRQAVGLLLPFAILLFHLAYGIGTIAGFASYLTSGPPWIKYQTRADVVSR